MRVAPGLAVVAAAAVLAGCAAPSWSQARQAPEWKMGFWFWGDSRPAETERGPVDVVYAQVGDIHVEKMGGREFPGVSAWLPAHLPPAREYWLVFRYQQQGVPPAALADQVAAEAARILADARRENLPIAGIQLDIDSPTRTLSTYAGFLKQVRQGLPRGIALSITGLLDWFRDGTDVDKVIAEVDEFVPQFYDVNNDRVAIASPVNAQRWAPWFNRFGKPYRIGISTFGRARFLEAHPSSGGGYALVYRQATPMDLATNQTFQLEESHNPAGELVLAYRASDRVRVGWTQFEKGDAMQFVLATPETVHNAVASARQLGGMAAGVVFFRWPNDGEVLTMRPDEVLDAAAVKPSAAPAVRVAKIEGGCAVVACADLYLEGTAPFSPKAMEYRVKSTQPFEYFLPSQSVRVRAAGGSELVASLPPFCGRGHMYLGRVVTKDVAEFSVEGQR
jgi:hypothetical protein